LRKKLCLQFLINSYISIKVRKNGSGNQSRMISPKAMATLDKQHTGRRQTPKNENMSNRNTTENCGWTHQLAKGKQFRFLYICINGVSLNPVEGRTTIWQLWNLILTLLGLIFRRIYVCKLNQTVLELDLWIFKFVFFPRWDLNSHHFDTLQHQSLILLSSALDHSTTSAIYIYIYKRN
jgi:hypothetical protein